MEVNILQRKDTAVWKSQQTVFILCLHLQVIIWFLVEDVFPTVSACASCSVSEQEGFNLGEEAQERKVQELR